MKEQKKQKKLTLKKLFEIRDYLEKHKAKTITINGEEYYLIK